MSPRTTPGLAGKVAIVAGGGAAGDGIGNGRAAAMLLARSGTKVLVVDRDLALAERTAEMIKAEGGTAAAHAADLTDDSAGARHGDRRLDRSAVWISSTTTSAFPAADRWWRKAPTPGGASCRSIVEPMFLASKYAIPAMIKTAGRGAIVNISSISALRPRRLTVYTAAKGAVIALTRAMAVDHAAEGIRVNCVAPGPVYTPMVYAGGMTDNARDQRRRASPLGVEGRGWDIGQRRALPAVGPCPLHHRPDAGRRRRRHAHVAEPRKRRARALPTTRRRKIRHGTRALPRQE